MKSKILLLISLIFIITACDSGPDDKYRTKGQRDQISEWRKNGYFVIDAYEETDPKRPLSDNTAIIGYDIPAEGDEIELDHRIYSGLGRIFSFFFNDESEKSAYERVVRTGIGHYRSEISEKIHGIWIFEPRLFEDGNISVDASDPYKTVVKIGKNESEKNRYLFFTIGWSFIYEHTGKYNYTKFLYDNPESRALPPKLISLFNRVIICQHGSSSNDESDLYEELISDPNFP